MLLFEIAHVVVCGQQGSGSANVSAMWPKLRGHLKLGRLSILIRRVASVIPSVCYLIG